uniref:Prominin-2 n=1 Tax=Ambystoma mexicanum TaxID=8296 RepID=A0A0B4KE61_AMBME|nr:prominin-2 [Ambystoma mexicanum]
MYWWRLDPGVDCDGSCMPNLRNVLGSIYTSHQLTFTWCLGAVWISCLVAGLLRPSSSAGHAPGHMFLLAFGEWRRGSLRLPPLYLMLAAALTMLGSVQGQQCVFSTNPEVLQFPDLGANFSVVLVAQETPGSLGPLYNMVHIFLDAVQPNPFPSDLLRDALNNASSISTTKVVKYQAGYVVCAILAGIYLVAMVLTGLIFFVCRWRGKCGGQVDRFNKNLIYKRNTFMAALLLTTILMLAGVACAFATNEMTTKEMDPSVRAIPSSLQGFRQLPPKITQAIEIIVSEFSVPKQLVIEDLKTVGQTIGNTITAKLNVTVIPLLMDAEKTAQDLQALIPHVRNLQDTTQSLQKRQVVLATALNDRRQNMTEVLSSDGCVSCADALSRVSSLELGANFSKVPSVAAVLKNLQDAAKVNMIAIFQKAFQSFNNIPRMVDEKSADGIQSTLRALATAEHQVKSIASEFQIERYTASLSTSLLKVEKECTKYGEEVKRYDHYRWIVGIVLCCVVLLIIVCNIVGLSLGLWGLYWQGDPTEDTSVGETGASILMSGAGLSFLFSWLLIALVLVTFVVGGNVQTLVCKSWSNGNMYKFLEEPGNLPPSMNLSNILGLKENMNISNAYQECSKGAPLWDILPLGENYDIEDALNISKYTGGFQKDIQNITIDLQEFILMKSIAQFWLGIFANSRIDHINYSLFTAEIQAPLVKTNLEEFSTQMETLAASQTNTTIQTQLAGEARALRDLESTVQAQAADVKKMNESVQFLAVIAPTVQTLTNRSQTDFVRMEEYLTVDTKTLLINEINCFVTKELGYFIQYVDWVNRTIMLHVASCQLVSASLDNARVALCENVINPWNGFWFSLGWCTLFLIPSIIFAVKTSKYFRPIRATLSPRALSLTETSSL